MIARCFIRKMTGLPTLAKTSNVFLTLILFFLPGAIRSQPRAAFAPETLSSLFDEMISPEADAVYPEPYFIARQLTCYEASRGYNSFVRTWNLDVIPFRRNLKFGIWTHQLGWWLRLLRIHGLLVW